MKKIIKINDLVKFYREKNPAFKLLYIKHNGYDYYGGIYYDYILTTLDVEGIDVLSGDVLVKGDTILPKTLGSNECSPTLAIKTINDVDYVDIKKTAWSSLSSDVPDDICEEIEEDKLCLLYLPEKLMEKISLDSKKQNKEIDEYIKEFVIKNYK